MGDRRRCALVTGGNRGIGLALCRVLRERGFAVVLTARRRADAEAAVQQLSSALPSGPELHAEELDLALRSSVGDCADRLLSAGLAIDVLVNNGGVLDTGNALTALPEDMENAVAVNLLGAQWTCQAFVPAMIERGYGRVVNVSSGWGSFAEGLLGPPAYAITKAALNALTVVWARAVAEANADNVKINAVSPGWVRTRMGGDSASLSADESARAFAWLCELPPEGPNGRFYRERDAIDW